MKVRGFAQGIWPQCKVDPLGPAGVRMRQLLACALREVSGGLLGDAILEVGIHTTKGKLLSHFVACLLEGVVLKSAAVAVVVEDFHSMFICILLEGKLGSKCFS